MLPGIELAPQELLGGARHKVQEPVKVEGYFGRFVIESESGNFSVAGVNMLGVRVSELQAIETLQKVQEDATFKDALAKSAGSVVTEPGKTVENIGTGVGTVFGRVGHLAKSGAQYVGDKASDLGSSSAPAKAGSAAPGEQEPASYTSDPFGYNQARREWAKKLNIDPYTTNPVLRPLLDKAASATFAGNFGVNLTMGAVAAPFHYAQQLDETVRVSVWNNPPIDLEKQNEAKLLSLGVAGRTVRNLLRNKWFTPTLQTALVARLSDIGKVTGLEAVVATASSLQGETRARFLIESLSMLADLSKQGTRLASIRMHGLIPVGRTGDGTTVAAVAIDYGVWDKDAAAFAQDKAFGAAKKTLLVAGKLSAPTQQGFERAGWAVKSGLRS